MAHPIRILLCPLMLMLAGCEVLDPPRATTLAPLVPVSADAPPDSFSDLTLPYPAAKISKRHQVPVGGYLRSNLKESFPNLAITVRAWEPKAEVRGRLGPHVIVSLGFDFEVLTQDGTRRRVADLISSDVGPMYLSHQSLTGLHSVDSRERPAPIHSQLKTFLDFLVEKLKWRLRERVEPADPRPAAFTPPATGGPTE